MNDFSQNFDHQARCRAEIASISLTVRSAARFLATAKNSLSSKSLRTTEAKVAVSPGFSVN